MSAMSEKSWLTYHCPFFSFGHQEGNVLEGSVEPLDTPLDLEKGTRPWWEARATGWRILQQVHTQMRHCELPAHEPFAVGRRLCVRVCLCVCVSHVMIQHPWCPRGSVRGGGGAGVKFSQGYGSVFKCPVSFSILNLQNWRNGGSVGKMLCTEATGTQIGCSSLFTAGVSWGLLMGGGGG